MAYLRKAILALLSALLVLPTSTFSQVIISEIAWMGTNESASDEWIELSNGSTVSVELSGWTLFAEDGSPQITLTGTLDPNGYFLLERSNDETVPNISADIIYTGALSNSGEVLILKDSAGTEVFRVESDTGWLAGDNINKYTMQWNGVSWLSAPGTPRAENDKTAYVTDQDKNSDTQTDSSLDTGVKTSYKGYSFPDYSAHMEPISVSDFTQRQHIYITAGRDRFVPVGGEVFFDARAIDSAGNEVNGVDFLWSFGDGTTSVGKRHTHIYSAPGEYVAVLQAKYGNTTSVSRAEVTVFYSNIELGIFTDGRESFLNIMNRSPHEINLGGYVVFSQEGKFLIPRDTLMGSGKSIALSSQVVDFSFGEHAKTTLLAPGGKLVGEVRQPEKIDRETPIQEDTKDLMKDMRAILRDVEAKALSLESQITNLSVRSPVNGEPIEEGEIEKKKVFESHQDLVATSLTSTLEETMSSEIFIAREVAKPKSWFSRVVDWVFGD